MPASPNIALLRIAAQRIVGSDLASPAAVGSWLTAMQGQDLPGALTAIALRVTDPQREAVIAAFNDGALVRSWPMRGTLHVVAAEDLPWMMETLGARGLASAKGRRRDLGIDPAATERAQQAATTALKQHGRLTRTELFAAWKEAGEETADQRGVHLLGQLCQLGVLCLGPLAGKEQLIVLVEDWIKGPRRLARDAALAELAGRFYRSHGPATVKDLARWAQLTVADAKAGTAAVAGDLETLEVNGAAYLMDPATPDRLADHRRAARGVLLLPGFDELVLGYGDRTATVAAEHSDLIVPGGNGMFKATVIKEGRAIGTWKRGGKSAAPAIDATAFGTFSAPTAKAIDAAYRRLTPALG
jgi:hypothetical protein